MATLQFKGKNIIWNHHMSVPYHTLDLDEKLSYKQDKADGNLIIEGDNLPALKSLLAEYSGDIDCIYIDPPYNTGQENWIYNDNVNSPLVKDWIGKVVGLDDLTRHDKWLTMMTPRLKLLYELMSENGVMFISIDEHEISSLTLLLKEIFDDNCLDYLVWRKTGKQTNTKRIDRVKTTHEYVLVVYRNKLDTTLGKVKLLPKWKGKKSNPDNDPRGNWESGIISKNEEKSNKKSENYYEITLPSGRKITREFYVDKNSFDNLLKDNRIYFPKDGDGIPRLKIFENEEQEYYLDSILDRYGTFTKAKKEIEEFFGDKDLFDTPKPTKLIKEIIRTATSKKSVVLDAFAGSGTTAQAVLELNEEDEGNRKFILIQMPENSDKEPKKNIARDITRERVVKVIEKKLKNKDVGFEYRRVGQPIDAETILSGQLPTYKQLAKYVYYLATGQSPKDKDIDEKRFLAGKVDHTEVYLLYTPDMEELKKMAITFEWAKEISKGNENKKIVYAPACFMDDEYLEQFNIKFVSIPYNLFEREK